MTDRFIGRVNSGHTARWDERPGADVIVSIDERNGAPIVRFFADVCGRHLRFYLTAGRARNLRDVIDRALGEIDGAPASDAEDDAPSVVVHVHHHGAPRGRTTPPKGTR